MTRLPLPTLLAQTLVAHTIELDNEAEHLLPHRTSREHDTSPQTRGAPWLVSYVLYANVLRYLEDGPLTVGELRVKARTDRLLLAGLTRWRFVTISAPGNEALRNPPQEASLVRATGAAATAQAVWRRLPAVIEERWRYRFGDDAVDALLDASGSVFTTLAITPPAYLPVVSPTQGGKIEAMPVTDLDPVTLVPRDLSSLVSGVLWAFTRDLETASRMSMAIGANTLRVLRAEGVRVRDLPRLTGVSKEANAMSTGWLQRHGLVVLEPDPGAQRGKILRLTTKGRGAQRAFHDAVARTEEEWRSRPSRAALDGLRDALQTLVGSGQRATSPLSAGLEPHPDNWRAAVAPPDTLPHHPMVLHRGAYPDGS
jgi:DNA-binding MarR family transcriptional regulator